MDFGQILQVVLSLGVVALALYLSARLARRRLGPGSDEALRVLARQSVSRTQNLVVVEANGHRHLLALTDGGAHTVQSWDAPAPETARSTSGPKHAALRTASRAGRPTLPALPFAASTRPARGRLRRRADTEAGSGMGPGMGGKAAPSASGSVAQRQGVQAGIDATEPTPVSSAAHVGGRGGSDDSSGSPEPSPTTGTPLPAGRGSFAAKLATVQARTQWAPLGRQVSASQVFASSAPANAHAASPARSEAPAPGPGPAAHTADPSAAAPAPDTHASAALTAAGSHRS